MLSRRVGQPIETRKRIIDDLPIRVTWPQAKLPTPRSGVPVRFDMTDGSPGNDALDPATL